MVAAALAATALVLAAFLLGDDTDPTPAAPGTPIADATGTLRAVVPAGWNEIENEPSRDSTVPRILAAPDASAYRARRDAPGMELLFTEGLTAKHIDQVLEEFASRSGAREQCTGTPTREPFTQRGFAGSIEVYTACGESGADLTVVAALGPGKTGLIVLSIQGATAGEQDLVLTGFAITN